MTWIRSVAFAPILMILAAGTTPCASGARELAGDWALGQVVESGDVATVPISVRLRNDSTADQLGAVLVLSDEIGPADIDSFPSSFDLRAGSSVLLTGTFIVPVRELKRWEHGGLPILLLQTEVGSDTFRAVVELGPRVSSLD
jgi:hypothetical protein